MQIGIEVAQCFNLAHAENLNSDEKLKERTKTLWKILNQLKEETINKLEEQETLVLPKKKELSQTTIIPEEMLEVK